MSFHNLLMFAAR